MAYISSATATIDSVLTRYGRELLSSNTKVFAPTQFAIDDGEINYQLLNDVVNIDQDSPDILALPIPEPSTNENNEMLSKVWVNNTFLGQQFSVTSATMAQTVQITTSVGDVGVLYSDDTTRTISVWVATLNEIDKPLIGSYYRFIFTNQYDFYTIQFVNPPLNSTINNNFNQISANEYDFHAVNSDSSGTYIGTPNGNPVIVFTVSLLETPGLFTALQDPTNAKAIIINNFLTVIAVDASNTQLPNVSPATLSLQINNVLN